jgi:hypothetical protein
VARRSSKKPGGKTGDQDTPRDEATTDADTAIGPGGEVERPSQDAAPADSVAPGDTPPVDGEASLNPETDASETDLGPTADSVPPLSGTDDATDDTPGAVLGDDTLTAEPLDPEAAATETTDADTVEGAATAADTMDSEGAPRADETEPPTEPAPDLDRPAEPAATRTIVERRGPGFVPLVLGGIVAAALGYFAANADLIPGLGGAEDTAEIDAALDRQSEALAALQSRIEELAATAPAAAPEVDLAPVTDRLDALGARLEETSGNVQSLAERVTTLEERPVFTGDVSQDAAEAAEAVAAMEEQVRAQEEEAARLAAEAEAAREAAENAIAEARAEAEAAAAEAEAEAARAAAAAEAEAALQRLRLAVAEGEPFAEPLGAVAEIAEVPEALAAAADTGVPTVEALQDRFPPQARAALPVALRETAGEGAMDRIGAFLQGQIGGRSIEPREGDDPDAVLSRAQAAVDDGDFAAALDEIAALPEAAQTAMADWITAARTRVEVAQALDTVAQAVTGTN